MFQTVRIVIFTPILLNGLKLNNAEARNNPTKKPSRLLRTAFVFVLREELKLLNLRRFINILPNISTNRSGL